MYALAIAMAVLLYGDVRLEVVKRTNDQRAAHGMQRLEVDDKLMQSAQQWAEIMAANGIYEHSAYPLENIAWGQIDAADIVGWWSRSPDHRAQMLGPHTVTGVGLAVAQNGQRC